MTTGTLLNSRYRSRYEADLDAAVKSFATGVTSGAGNAYPSGTPEFTLGF
jgi:hypothetical protein